MLFTNELVGLKESKTIEKRPSDAITPPPTELKRKKTTSDSLPQITERNAQMKNKNGSKAATRKSSRTTT